VEHLPPSRSDPSPAQPAHRHRAGRQPGVGRLSSARVRLGRHASARTAPTCSPAPQTRASTPPPAGSTRTSDRARVVQVDAAGENMITLSPAATRPSPPRPTRSRSGSPPAAAGGPRPMVVAVAAERAHPSARRGAQSGALRPLRPALLETRRRARAQRGRLASGSGCRPRTRPSTRSRCCGPRRSRVRRRGDARRCRRGWSPRRHITILPAPTVTVVTHRRCRRRHLRRARRGARPWRRHRHATRWAVHAGALAVTGRGAQSAMPDSSAVRALLAHTTGALT